jgi:hypothetical protein
MKNIYKLLTYSKEIERGFILRCKGDYPYEEVVDFLVCEPFTLERKGARLVVASGYKAGLTFVVLPAESLPSEDRFGLNTEWLKENWSKWGYCDCPIEDVWVLEGYMPKLPDSTSE